MKIIEFMTNHTKPLALISACFVLATVCATSVHAQLDVTFEFDSAFGKKAFYDRGPNFDTNSIPPEGFNTPTGIAFQSSNRIIVADRGNL